MSLVEIKSIKLRLSEETVSILKERKRDWVGSNVRGMSKTAPNYNLNQPLFKKNQQESTEKIQTQTPTSSKWRTMLTLRCNFHFSKRPHSVQLVRYWRTAEG